MIAKINIDSKEIKVNLNDPIDISMPLKAGVGNASAWYVDGIAIDPVRAESFTGSVKEGGSVNFRTISFNPHGNGTHTECLGHITEEVYSVNKAVKKFFSLAKVITIAAEAGTNDSAFSSDDDRILTLNAIRNAIGENIPESIVIRTKPNNDNKLHQNWSSSNWAQLDHQAAKWLAEKGVKNLLIDLPSVDREMDGGKLLSHHAFWQVPQNPRMDASITEMIYVRDAVEDGSYLLELQFAPFENDASPSRPVLYKLL